MYLSKIRIKNYKSFRDSGDIEFKPGINIIVGQNNSGKTSLLETLGLKFDFKNHKSIRSDSKPFINKLFSNEFKVIYSVFVSSDELSKSYIGQIPYPEDGRLSKAVEDFHFQSKNGLNLTFESIGKEISSKTLSYGLYKETKGRGLSISKDMDGFYEASSNQSSSSISNSDNIFGWKEILDLTKNIYRFNAERLNLGRCLHGTSRHLKPNASNLAEVLQNTLLENFRLYEEIIDSVKQVIPSIKWLDSKNIEEAPTNQFANNSSKYQEIRVWLVDRDSKKEQFTIPLSECGTGIGQVLAILYIVITSQNQPRTIIIDEPNSFLHPSASKKLIQILNQFPQHQYFNSTHSPEILATANPSTVTMLKYEDGETRVEQLDLSQGNNKLKLVSELGMEISDFFFAENVLWVEGPTEAKTFPMILARSSSLFNFVAVPLVHTDDLKDRKRGRKHAKTNIENIRRLSGEYALTPPKIFTVLDREDTSDQEIQDLEKLGINFIPRRLFENYLLDAEAITEILNSEIIEETEKTTVEQVENILATSQKEFSDETVWLQKVHGAKLLEKIFSEISKATVEYRKTTHSVELTKWLLENKPEQLKELQDFLISIIEIG